MWRRRGGIAARRRGWRDLLRAVGYRYRQARLATLAAWLGKKKKRNQQLQARKISLC